MVVDSENIVPSQAPTSSSFKSAGFSRQTVPLGLQKSRLQGSISRSRPPGTKRRALGDITNKRKETAQDPLKVSQKPSVRTPLSSRNRWTELPHVRRIPTDNDGNVSSPETIPPPGPLPSFEPPQFDFVQSPEREPKRSVVDVFDELKSPDSPMRSCPKPPQIFSDLEFDSNPLRSNDSVGMVSAKSSHLFAGKEFELELS